MAENFKAMWIGIILSGAGTEGALGAFHMHELGGTVIVQNPETAQFEGMPLSAISKDHPEQILSPGKLADALMK